MIEIPVEGIATDAAHSTKNKITEFQGIDLRTGKRIFYQNLGNKTVNIGEFLGVVEAAKYIIENDYSPRRNAKNFRKPRYFLKLLHGMLIQLKSDTGTTKNGVRPLLILETNKILQQENWRIEIYKSSFVGSLSSSESPDNVSDRF